jgi:hypothetical protein
MNLRAVLALAVLAATTPEIGYFRYQRPVANLPQQAGQTCVAIDGGVFAHAAPGLADLRLYRDQTETPYALHVAAAVEGAEKSISVLNLGQRAGQIAFDAAMPEGHYSDVALTVGAQDFIATVTVMGSQAETGGAETKLGAFTIFDLTKQKLGRSTVLHLPDSDFRYLHFQVAGPLRPENITGLNVGRLPAGQPKYVTVSESASVTQAGHDSGVEFTVPANVPVDRIVFAPAGEPVNFSRDVNVMVTQAGAVPASETEGPRELAANSGNLLRIHSVQSGQKIEEERLTLDAPGSGFAAQSKWKITIDNGDDRPLALSSVRLEMLERNLCFDAAADAAYTLYYGDAELAAPRYDYARLFAYDPSAPRATVGAEQMNAAFHARPDPRPFTERHPTLLWVALIVVIGLLGLIALRSAKRPAGVA